MGLLRSGLGRGSCALLACALAASCGPNRTGAGQSPPANVAAANANAASPANDAVVEAADAEATNEAEASGWTPGSEDVTIDLFTAASADRWTPLRNRWDTLVAVARLTPARDAALVTWQAGGQMWCGTAIPEDECQGGRFLMFLVKPQALPGAATLDDRSMTIMASANGVPFHQQVQDIGLPSELRNKVVQTPIRGLHSFMLMIDYQQNRAFRRQLDHCRQIIVQLLGRRFTFACDGLPKGDP